jgi:leucyl aminopeptidase
MKNQLCFTPISGIETELLVVPAADMQVSQESGAKAVPVLLTADEKVKAAATDVLVGGEFKAGANETLLLHAPVGLAARRLLLVGLGKQSKVNVNSVRNAAGTAVRFAKPRGIRKLVFALPETELPPSLCARAAVEGAIAGDFNPDTYCTSRKDRSVASFTLAAAENGDKATLETSFAEGVIAGESQTFARALVNEPGNKLTPTIARTTRRGNGRRGWTRLRGPLHR